MSSEQGWIKENEPWLLPFLYLFGRIILFLTLIPYGYYGIGDLSVYREWTALPGWPYLDYWVEYPPLFPFLSEILFRMAGEQSFLYDFLVALVLAFAGSVILYLFQKITSRLYGDSAGQIRSLTLFGIMVVLPYTWWYADVITLALMMAGIWSLLEKKDKLAGLWIGLGMLAKWFPVFLLPALFRYRPLKNLLLISGIAITIVSIVFGILFVVSPQMTRASLLTQTGRASWQTVWALIDRNLTTGAYLTTEQRLDPSQYLQITGNPAVIPPSLTLFVFGGIGVGLLLKRNRFDDLSLVAAIGITWSLFLLWSPGWSSQWVLYVIPLVLLTLSLPHALSWILGFVLINILEFPFLLGRGLADHIWIVIILRVFLIVIIQIIWAKEIINKTPMQHKYDFKNTHDSLRL